MLFFFIDLRIEMLARWIIIIPGLSYMLFKQVTGYAVLHYTNTVKIVLMYIHRKFCTTMRN